MANTENKHEGVYDCLAREAAEYQQFIDTSIENRTIVPQWNSINAEIMVLRNDWKVLKDLQRFLTLTIPTYISKNIEIAKKTINNRLINGVISRDKANLLDWEDIRIKPYALNYNLTTPFGIVRRDIEEVPYVFFAESALNKYVKPILDNFFPGRVIDTGKGYYNFNLNGLSIEEIIERGRMALAQVEQLMSYAQKNIEEGYGITVEQLEVFKGDPVRFNETTGKIEHIGLEPDWDKNWGVLFEPFVGMDQCFILSYNEPGSVLSRKH